MIELLTTFTQPATPYQRNQHRRALRQAGGDETLLRETFTSLAAASTTLLIEEVGTDPKQQLTALLTQLLELQRTSDESRPINGDGYQHEWWALVAIIGVWADTLEVNAPTLKVSSDQWGPHLGAYLQFAPSWEKHPPTPPDTDDADALIDALIQTHCEQVESVVACNRDQPDVLLNEFVRATLATEQVVGEQQAGGSDGTEIALGWEIVTETLNVYATMLDVTEGAPVPTVATFWESRYLKWAVIGAVLVAASVALQVVFNNWP